MVFKLSEQLNDVGDPNLPFALYDSYLDQNRRKFPESVLELLQTDKWHGGSDSEAPYNSTIRSFNVDWDVDNSRSHAILTLHKVDYVPEPIWIQVRYLDIVSINIPVTKAADKKWRYDEFLFHVDKTADKGTKFYTHCIEMVDGDIWRITATDIEVTWTKSPQL